MRLPRISLAAKYRLLFGLAVLLIIAAALSMPWYYLKWLTLEAPYREAQRAAEDYLHFVLGHPAEQRPPPHAHQGLDEPAPAMGPRFVRFTFNLEDPDSMVRTLPEDAFARQALRAFQKDHLRTSAFQRTSVGEAPAFRYARAVWVSRSCLTCHAEGQSAQPFRENELAGLILVTLPARDSLQALFRNQLVLVVAGALSGLLAILLFYAIVQRFILAPIQELRRVTLRVTDGDLGVRANVRTGDEFEQLSNNLNAMLERLRDSQLELRAANRLLDEKLGQLAESNVALFEASRIKSEFLATVSHELRTPLTNIIGFAELLREGPAARDLEKVKRYSENVLISGRILQEIINDLLDLAKIEAGKVDLNSSPVDVSDLCRTMTDIMRPQADKKEITLSYDPSDPPERWQTDEGKLRQILFNLMSNAIKFTQPGGRVQIVAALEPDERLYLAVTDNGPGIAAEDQVKIFEKFRQLERSETRTQGGTGLGLAIAKELTSLMNGQMGVVSALGQGATFWVRLPQIEGKTVQRPLTALTTPAPSM